MFEASQTREPSVLRALGVFTGTFLLGATISLIAINLLLSRLTTVTVIFVFCPAVLSGPLVAAVLNHLALGPRLRRWIDAVNALSFGIAAFLGAGFLLLACAASSGSCRQVEFPAVLLAPPVGAVLAHLGSKRWARRRRGAAEA
jgi:hypothetical protein